jgi:iron(III) transport system substrate-binding protein
MAAVLLWGLALASLALVVGACNGGDNEAGPDPVAPKTGTVDLKGVELVVYSGRSEVLVQPVLDAFAKSTGAKVRVRYASTAAIAATVLEEGGNSPADVVLMQDAGSLGALAREGRLDQVPEELLARVDPRFRSP